MPATKMVIDPVAGMARSYGASFSQTGSRQADRPSYAARMSAAARASPRGSNCIVFVT